MSEPFDPERPAAPGADPRGEPVRGSSHPDELLAAYVDGSASPDEAAEAERHLAACAACRSDVDAARAGLDALRGLPEVASPWEKQGDGSLVAAAVAGEVLETVPAAPSKPPPPVVNIRERRGSPVRWSGTAAAALAAAAVLAVIVVVLSHSGSGVQSAGNAPTQAGGGSAAPPTVTQKDLMDLTNSLATGKAPVRPPGAPSGAPVRLSTASGSGELATPVPAQLAADATSGIPCARRASAQPDSAVAVYAQLAVFDHQRVWVIGFLSSGPSGQQPRVVVVAVTVDNCSVVFLTREPLSS